MSDTTTQETWADLTAVELGLLIGGVALVLIIFIIVLTAIYVHVTRSKNRQPQKNDDDNEKMVNMQTSRYVGGQPMQQVIRKSQPNGNMDRYTNSSEKLQTMDTETHTVRYDTANPSLRHDSQAQMVEAVENVQPTKKADADEGSDSGTGDSPMRTAVVIHSDGEDKEGGSHSDEEVLVQGVIHETGEDNGAYSSDEEPIPYTMTVPPPPPLSDPPPPTPGMAGIPVTDLDGGETIMVTPTPPSPSPPPPPPADMEIYAEVNKNRNSTLASSAAPIALDSSQRSFYRDVDEIQIIEREKF